MHGTPLVPCVEGLEVQGVQSALGELLDDWRDEEKRLTGKLELTRMDLHALANPEEASRDKQADRMRDFRPPRWEGDPLYA